MKKILLIFVILTLFLSSCGEKKIINPGLTGDALKAQFPEMYPMPVEDCKHHILFSKPIDDMGLDYSSFDYHYEYCSYPNCEYESGIRQHSDLWAMVSCYQSFIADDGYAYHKAEFSCIECYKTIKMSIRCKNGVANCNSCYDVYNRFLGYHTMDEWKQAAKGEKELSP